MTDVMPRTVLVSLLLHLAAVICFVSYGGREREKPVVIDLSLFEPPGGAPDGGSKTAAKRGGGEAPAAGGSMRAPMAAPAPSARQLPPSAPAATPIKAAEMPPPVPLRPPTAPLHPAQAAPLLHPHPQAEPVREKDLSPRGAASPVAGTAASTAGNAASKGAVAGSHGHGGAPGKGEEAHSVSGNGGPHGSGIGSGTELQKKYVAENFAYIMRIIQNRMVYPEKARREGLSGKARVSFVVLENGEVTDIKLLSRTGYEILDANLVKTIRKAAPFPRPPIKAELQMMLSYRLDQ